MMILSWNHENKLGMEECEWDTTYMEKKRDWTSLKWTKG